MIEYNDSPCVSGAVDMLKRDLGNGKGITNRLFRSLLPKIGYETAQDVMQNFYLRLVSDERRNGEREFPNERARMGFIWTVLNSALKTHISSQMRMKEVQAPRIDGSEESIFAEQPGHSMQPSDAIETSDNVDAVYRAMSDSNISPATSLALVMSSQGVPYSEISPILEISKLKI